MDVARQRHCRGSPRVGHAFPARLQLEVVHVTHGNRLLTRNVIECVMRKNKMAWIRMVSVFALLLGALPGSVFASLVANPDCSMPCCVGVPAHQPTVKACASGCDTSSSQQSKPASQFEASASNCNCEIGSAPTQPQPVVATVPSAESASDPVWAVMALGTSFRFVTSALCLNPGILEADSGPPTSRPNYATFGRAPPVP